MTLRNPLVIINGRVQELPSGDTIGGAPPGADGANGANGTDGTTSISNSDGTLTISPTTGASVASLNLAHANTWIASQTFRAGSTAPATAGVYLQSGALMTTPEVGAIEFLTDKFYGTITTGTARTEFALWNAAGTSGRVPYETTNGRLTDSANITFDGTKLTVAGILDSALTSGRIPYATISGELTDSANLRWDNTNTRFGIGGAPSKAFHAQGSVNGEIAGMLSNASSGTGAYTEFFIVNNQASFTNYIGIAKTSTGFTTAGLIVADSGLINESSGSLLIATSAAKDVIVSTNGTGTTNERLRADSNGNVSVGNAALATTATNGFLYIPTCAGTPTGVPTSKTGRVPMVYDTTNNKLYCYNSGWKGVTLA